MDDGRTDGRQRMITIVLLSLGLRCTKKTNRMAGFQSMHMSSAILQYVAVNIWSERGFCQRRSPSVSYFCSAVVHRAQFHTENLLYLVYKSMFLSSEATSERWSGYCHKLFKILHTLEVLDLCFICRKDFRDVHNQLLMKKLSKKEEMIVYMYIKTADNCIWYFWQLINSA